MIFEIDTYAGVIPFAAFQAFLLTRKRRIWHIIMPLLLSLLLLDAHLSDIFAIHGHNPDCFEFTASMLQFCAPPMYRLMCVLFNYYDTMSFPDAYYLTTSGVLMSVGLFLYKIILFWCVVKSGNYLHRKIHST